MFDCNKMMRAYNQSNGSDIYDIYDFKGPVHNKNVNNRKSSQNSKMTSLTYFKLIWIYHKYIRIKSLEGLYFC